MRGKYILNERLSTTYSVLISKSEYLNILKNLFLQRNAEKDQIEVQRG